MTGRRLLLLGLGRTGHPYLEQAKARGLSVSIVDRPSLLRADAVRSLLGPADEVCPVPVLTEEAYYSAGSQAVLRNRVDGVLAVSEPQVVPAALLAGELGLPGPGLHAAVVSRNKVLQRQLFARHRVRQPDFHLAHGGGDALRWAGDRYPVVLKPLSGSGSSGVRIATGPGDVTAWSFGRDGPFLVEEFRSGPEYSLEGVVKDGEMVFAAVTAKVTTEPPYCVELEHLAPAPLAAPPLAAVEDLGRRVAAAIGVGTSVIHLEFKLGPEGPVVVEVAVRGAGDHILDITREAVGVNMYEAGVALATGGDVHLTRVRADAAMAWFPTAAPGRVRRVSGLDQVRGLAGVLAVRLDVAPGDLVPPLRSSTDRIGSVLLRGRTVAAAQATLAEARRLLVVHTESPDR